MPFFRLLFLGSIWLCLIATSGIRAQTTTDSSDDTVAEREWKLDWPREYVDDGAKLILHQPQITARDDYEVLHALVAVA